MKVTKINSDKFKTNLYAIYLTRPLIREEAAFNSLLSLVLKRGTKNYKDQLLINRELEMMYGASLDVAIDKHGDNVVLKFYMEVLDDKYTLEDESLSQKAIAMLKEIVFEPLIEDEDGKPHFDKEYVKQEKENLKNVIESRSDDKKAYSQNRLIEEMFDGEPFGVYKYGSIEDVDKIDEYNLYEYYIRLMATARVNFYACGNVNNVFIDETTPFEEGVWNNDIGVEHEPRKEIKYVTEKMDVTQGKLLLGLNVGEADFVKAQVFNAILGNGANSKLFQNVREKASLAYYAASRYLKRKNAIIINTGIEINNYDRALKIIREQLEAIKNGEVAEFELTSAKELICALVRLIDESETDMITDTFEKELYDENYSNEEYMNQIMEVTKEDVIEVAKSVNIDTIYFLRN